LKEIVKLILEIKEKNPSYRCPRIALLASKLTGQTIDEHLVRRILRRHFHFPSGGGPSWLKQIGKEKDSLWSLDLFRCESILLKTHWVMLVMDQFTREIVGFAVHQGNPDGITVCQMFSLIQQGKKCPRYLSTDHDPLFRFEQWEANMRVLEIDLIKTVPYVPISHPFVERLIGTVRREFLDETLFWNENDLQKKLQEFARYYNSARAHYSLSGLTPAEKSSGLATEPIDLKKFRWNSFCSGRFSVPCAA
jgi:transposase InsO family protein